MDLAAGIEVLKAPNFGGQQNELKVSIDQDNQSILLDYQPASKRAFCDLCDQSGNVIHSQTIEHDSTRIPLASLLKGKYQIFIMDAGNMLRYPIDI